MKLFLKQQINFIILNLIFNLFSVKNYPSKTTRQKLPVQIKIRQNTIRQKYIRRKLPVKKYPSELKSVKMLSVKNRIRQNLPVKKYILIENRNIWHFGNF